MKLINTLPLPVILNNGDKKAIQRPLTRADFFYITKELKTPVDVENLPFPVNIEELEGIEYLVPEEQEGVIYIVEENIALSVNRKDFVYLKSPEIVLHNGEPCVYSETLIRVPKGFFYLHDMGTVKGEKKLQ